MEYCTITWTTLRKGRRGLFTKPMLTICFWAQVQGEQGEYNAGQSAEIEVEADWDQYIMFAAQERYPHLVAAWDALCQRLIDEGWDLVTKEEMDNWWTYAFRRRT